MRQQQNRRSKNRGNQNRKPQNPLSKTYDSSGPGVKVRGNAQHIYEKYMALARDAQTSGDYVVYENFAQHAEHYKRIIIEATPIPNPEPLIEEELSEETESTPEVKKTTMIRKRQRKDFVKTAEAETEVSKIDNDAKTYEIDEEKPKPVKKPRVYKKAKSENENKEN